MRKTWTPEEDTILREEYKEETDVDRLAKKLGRSTGSIKHRTSRLGLKVRDGRKRKKWLGKRQYWYWIVNRTPIFEHRVIAEKKIGRKLTSDDIVHHLDGDTLNNDPNNLVVTTRAEHMGTYHLDICLEKLAQINNR